MAINPKHKEEYHRQKAIDHSQKGFAIHPKDTGYGYASGRKLKYPAFKWSNGKYVPAQAAEAVHPEVRE